MQNLLLNLNSICVNSVVCWIQITYIKKKYAYPSKMLLEVKLNSSAKYAVNLFTTF